MATRDYVLRKGGPRLLDLRVAANTVRVGVNGPGMLFAYLQLVTSLDMDDGFTVSALDAFASDLDVIALGGHVGEVAITPRRVDTRIGSTVEIDLGPMGMYQTDLVLSTKSGDSFSRLIQRTLAQSARGRYLVALEAIPATGHHEGPAVDPFTGEQPASPSGEEPHH